MKGIELDLNRYTLDELESMETIRETGVCELKIDLNGIRVWLNIFTNIVEVSVLTTRVSDGTSYKLWETVLEYEAFRKADVVQYIVSGEI